MAWGSEGGAPRIAGGLGGQAPRIAGCLGGAAPHITQPSVEGMFVIGVAPSLVVDCALFDAAAHLNLLAKLWPCLFCLQYLSLRPDPPRNNWPAPGQLGLPTPHFYRQISTRPWASPAPNSSPLSTGPGPAQHPNPSLLSTAPVPAWSQTLHSYWPDPSLLLARPITSIGHTLMASSWPSWAIPTNRSMVYC